MNPLYKYLWPTLATSCHGALELPMLCHGALELPMLLARGVGEGPASPFQPDWEGRIATKLRRKALR